ISHTFANNGITWTLTFNSCTHTAGDTTVCYTLSRTGGDANAQISHFNICLCAELQGALQSVIGPDGSAASSKISDNPNGVNPFVGVSITNASPGQYCLTFTGNWSCGCTTAYLFDASEGSSTNGEPIQGVECVQLPPQGCPCDITGPSTSCSGADVT